MNGNVQCATVTLALDQQLEGDGQMFVIAISSLTPPEVVFTGSPNVTVVTIADDPGDGEGHSREFQNVHYQITGKFACFHVFHNYY